MTLQGVPHLLLEVKDDNSEEEAEEIEADTRDAFWP